MKSLKNRFHHPHTDRPLDSPCIETISYITFPSCMYYVFSPILSKTYYITRTRLRLHPDLTPLTHHSFTDKDAHMPMWKKQKHVQRAIWSGLTMRVACLLCLVFPGSHFITFLFLDEWDNLCKWMACHSALSCSVLTLPGYAKSSQQTGNATSIGTAIKQ